VSDATKKTARSSSVEHHGMHMTSRTGQQFVCRYPDRQAIMPDIEQTSRSDALSAVDVDTVLRTLRTSFGEQDCIEQVNTPHACHVCVVCADNRLVDIRTVLQRRHQTIPFGWYV
jgi:hypothetical protein